MQVEEQRLLDMLFSRLKNTGELSAPRDKSAEKHIAKFIRHQPAAPYYMAQTILIQGAAIKQLNTRIQKLEKQVARSKATHGGFFSRLFGIANSHNIPVTSGIRPHTQLQDKTLSDDHFMTDALQTASRVTGGEMSGDLLNNVFANIRPEEIIKIIQEQPDTRNTSSIDNDPYICLDSHNDFSGDSTCSSDSGCNNDSSFSGDYSFGGDCGGGDCGGGDCGGGD